jgi:hypothetical protein
MFGWYIYQRKAKDIIKNQTKRNPTLLHIFISWKLLVLGSAGKQYW